MQVNNSFYFLNPLQGLARTLLALGTALVLLFSDVDIIFHKTPLVNSGLSYFFTYQINLFYLFGFKFGKIFALIILFFIIIGFKPRYFYILHFWVSLSFLSVCKFIEGGDQINYLVTLYLLPLILVDSRNWHWQFVNIFELSEKNKFLVREVSLFVLILVSLQGFVIYFHACLGKFVVPEWINGTVLYYWFNDNFFGAPSYLRSFLI